MRTQRRTIPNIRRDLSSVTRPNIEQLKSQGQALRERVPRSSHAEWAAPRTRPDPIKLLQHSDRGRLPDLLPIRYDRMCQSPFAFFRGSAAVMAWDLSKTPATGIRVQACGDCHAANFGSFASPERRLLFDINDFDETLPALWEWDVKRLAASVVLASRELGMGGGRCREAVLKMAESYRRHMRDYVQMRALEVWYSHMAAEVFIEEAKTAEATKRWQQVEEEARLETGKRNQGELTWDFSRGLWWD
jgi:uncharacterized protein (DUF2252 family)